MSILSIDPGLRTCGAAIWDGSSSNDLIWAGLIKNPMETHPLNPTFHSATWRGMTDAVDAKLSDMFGLRKWPDRMAIELPQVYRAVRSKGDPNDLIMLTGVVGGLVQWFKGMSFCYLPHSWKGTVPKPIMTERILKRLSDDEKSKIEKSPKSLIHNVYDACGLGLFHLRRL